MSLCTRIILFWGELNPDSFGYFHSLIIVMILHKGCNALASITHWVGGYDGLFFQHSVATHFFPPVCSKHSNCAAENHAVGTGDNFSVGKFAGTWHNVTTRQKPAGAFVLFTSRQTCQMLILNYSLMFVSFLSIGVTL